MHKAQGDAFNRNAYTLFLKMGKKRSLTSVRFVDKVHFFFAPNV